MLELYPIVGSLWIWFSVLAVLAILALSIQLHYKSSDVRSLKKVEEALRKDRDRVRSENDELKNPAYINSAKFPERGKYESRSAYLQRIWRFISLEDFVDTRIDIKEQSKKVRQGRAAHQVYEDAHRTMQDINETLDAYGRTASFPNARRVTMDDIRFAQPTDLTYTGDSTTRGRVAFGQRVAWELPEPAPVSGLRNGEPEFSPRHETFPKYVRRAATYADHQIYTGIWTDRKAREYLEQMTGVRVYPSRQTGRPSPTHFEGVRAPKLSIFEREGRPEGWRPWMLLNVAGDGLFCGVPHYRPRYESIEAYRKRILAYVIDAYVVRGWSLERAVEFADHKWTAFQKDGSDWEKLAREVAEGRAVPKTFHVNIMTQAEKVTEEVSKAFQEYTPEPHKKGNPDYEKACNNKINHRAHEWTSRRKIVWHCPGS